jgi:23S rRNA pseudouridine1911/1915/1917 synthase
MTGTDAAGSQEKKTVFTITEEYEGIRIDRVLAALVEDRSRSFLKKLFAEGRILVNGKEVKPSAKAEEGDLVTISIPDQVLPDIEAEDIPLDILYEDDDVLVVNKPKGMVVHPAAGHYSGTLVNAVMFHCRDNLSGINGVLRPGIVHRIDKDTTGSVIICKNDAAHRSIAAQLKDHSITRKYYAICYGRLHDDDITVDQPIGRDYKERKKMAVMPGGKRAVTHIHVLERFRDYSFVECVLETGRTHQIRVHMAYIKHPLIGDAVYQGRRTCPYETFGQCLHAGVLGFVHPVSGEYVETKAPLPEYFKEILEKLRRQS